MTGDRQQELRDAQTRLGTRVGEVTIDRLLGVGGMGVVYAGHHAGMSAPCAIKLAKPRCGEALLAEARQARQIESEHVVKIFTVSEAPEPHIVMELLHGCSLEAELNRCTKLQPSVAVDFALQILEGVAAIHARGRLHRDLKPSNLFLTIDAAAPDPGRRALVKVLDFGLVKRTRLAQTTRGNQPSVGDASMAPDPLQQTSGRFGTVGYMAPEQLGRWSDVDAGARHQLDGIGKRTDLYAVGLVLYEMLLGEGPYDLDTHQTTFDAMRRGPRLDTKQVPRPLRRVLKKALAFRADDRYPSAEAFARALRATQRSRASAPTMVASTIAATTLIGATLLLLRPSVAAPIEPGHCEPAPVASSQATEVAAPAASSVRRPPPSVPRSPSTMSQPVPPRPASPPSVAQRAAPATTRPASSASEHEPTRLPEAFAPQDYGAGTGRGQP